MPYRWVTGDTVYSGGRRLRFVLKQRGQPFVLTLAYDEPLWRDGPVYRPAAALASELLWRTRPDAAHILAWSRWRRRHQAQAMHCHYAKREAQYTSEVRL